MAKKGTANALTYDDFLNRLSIQEVLVDAGYHLNKRDGLRYPSYVRTDSEGRRVRGDKCIVTQNGKCWTGYEDTGGTDGRSSRYGRGSS